MILCLYKYMKQASYTYNEEVIQHQQWQLHHPTMTIMTHLFSSIDDILWIVQAASTRSTNHRVVARGSVCYLNSCQLLHWFAQSHSAHEQASVCVVCGCGGGR